MYGVYTSKEIVDFINNPAADEAAKKMSNPDLYALAEAMEMLGAKIRAASPDKVTKAFTEFVGNYSAEDYEIPIRSYRLIAQKLEEMSKTGGLSIDKMIDILKMADNLNLTAEKFAECEVKTWLGSNLDQPLTEETREQIIGKSIDILIDKNSNPTLVNQLVKVLPENITPELKTRLEEISNDQDDRATRAKQALSSIADKERDDKRNLIEIEDDGHPDHRRDVRYEDS